MLGEKVQVVAVVAAKHPPRSQHITLEDLNGNRNRQMVQ
jgi:hypothetical protein